MSYQVTPVTYTCKFCHRPFVREQAYMNHTCKQMKREAELKTPDGQTAWNYYQTWMRAQHKLSHSSNHFITSNYFRTFNNFVQFARKVKLPFPDKFIRLMIAKKYPPTMWTNDEVYSQYMDFIDSTVPPLELVNETISTLWNYADNKEVELSEVFDEINPNDLLQLISTRKVSPWLLLNSAKFKTMFAKRLNGEQQSIIESLIQFDYWDQKINQNGDVKKNIRRLVSEAGL